jgi:hypothetical protein
MLRIGAEQLKVLVCQVPDLLQQAAIVKPKLWRCKMVHNGFDRPAAMSSRTRWMT